MHSGFEIPGHQHQQPTENTCTPVLLSMNQTHILDQIHTLPATQQRLFLDQNHFLPPHHHQQSRLNHHYAGGASSAYFPVNFKLGLNEICARNDYKDGRSINNEGDANLVRGSEQYEVPEARHSSLGMLHCWQNQQDSPNKQPPPFWEHLPAEVSNENSEIIDRQEMNINQKEAPLTNCLDSKSRVHFGELEAIYKRLGTSERNQTGPSEINFPQLPPVGTFDNGSEEEASKKTDTKKKNKKKKRKENGYNNQVPMSPMVDFFGNLVKQVMEHQENLHRKFTEVIERLDEERRAREEAWRNQELAHFEHESEARAREKALAESREALIVSYLEKITGESINFPAFDPKKINSAITRDELGPNDEHD
ncbi:hypothetical protein DH2020_046662 [Rehmannia glutinosa]|uniref:Uncharacterized protein n=1 Tax=Rehmannia glutinosa TaxID=99300 RepID=A0ABR0UAS5_REHGL